ncbi:MAG: ATP-binding cassette domain-containing protein, partial [Cyclobacteriaceae bacterium]|nr:ATP-binding cassette domain-containing protein [Cyclobacteriaceae bacterium]
MIYARNVLFNYPNEKTLSFPDLEIKEKEHCILLGNSGSGKTTFLHILAGLLSPTQGEVIIQGKDITSMSGREMDQFRGQNIGIVFQTAHLIPAFSVEENLKA